MMGVGSIIIEILGAHMLNQSTKQHLGRAKPPFR